MSIYLLKQSETLLRLCLILIGKMLLSYLFTPLIGSLTRLIAFLASLYEGLNFARISLVNGVSDL